MTAAETSSQWRIWAAHLALAALLMRALLPTGWMPSHDISIPLVICTMDGLKTIAPHDSDPPAKSAQPDICPFATASTAFVPTSVALVLAVAFLEAAFSPRHDAPRKAVRYGPSSPRAPPVLS